jgi:hypothetical protein
MGVDEGNQILGAHPSVAHTMETLPDLEAFSRMYIAEVKMRQRRTLEEQQQRTEREARRVELEASRAAFKHLPDILGLVLNHGVTVELCARCRHDRTKVCVHLTAEELAEVWRLRVVSTVWRDAVDEWFRRSNAVLEAHTKFSCGPRQPWTMVKRCHERSTRFRIVYAYNGSQTRSVFDTTCAAECLCYDYRYTEFLKWVRTRFGSDVWVSSVVAGARPRPTANIDYDRLAAMIDYDRPKAKIDYGDYLVEYLADYEELT